MPERLAKAWLLAAFVLLLLATSTTLTASHRLLTDKFFFDLDRPFLFSIGGAAALLAFVPPVGRFLAELNNRVLGSAAIAPLAAFAQSRWAVPALAAIVAAGATAGVWVVFEGYSLSLDEFVATFGAAIHSHGELMASVAPAWRSYVAALQPEFVSWDDAANVWTSSYLPVNSALRALAGLLGAQALAGPLLAALSVIAVHAIARKLWPERPFGALAAAILLATSSQLLVTAMTAYAMTAHLAFNLVWLWLFLRGGRLGHLGALTVGFLACGLHQLVFHPLFVAPFILQAALDRRWRIVALYSIGYGLICLFWMHYWPLATHWSGVANAVAAPHSAGATASTSDQVISLLSSLSLGNIGLMAQNLVRFTVWQNPLLIALLTAGSFAAAAARGTIRALLVGIVLAVVATTVLLPYQGHGWGYRYLHGFLGSAALIAAYTWNRLTAFLAEAKRRAAQVGFVGVSLASTLLLTPAHAWEAHRFAAPYAKANSAIRVASVDVVLLDERDSWFTRDLVRNDPYLRSRPLVMRLAALSDAQVLDLCRRYSLGIFDARVADRYGIRTYANGPSDAPSSARLAAVSRLSCGVSHRPVRELD